MIIAIWHPLVTTGFDSIDGNMNHGSLPPPVASMPRRNSTFPRASIAFPRSSAALRTPIARLGKRGGPESLRRAFPETEATMLQHRPRAPLRPWLRSLSFALLASIVLPAAAFAVGDDVRELPVERLTPGARGGSSVFSTSNSNCPGASCDTVWVGHSNSGPGGAFLGV